MANFLATILESQQQVVFTLAFMVTIASTKTSKKGLEKLMGNFQSLKLNSSMETTTTLNVKKCCKIEHYTLSYAGVVILQYAVISIVEFNKRNFKIWKVVRKKSSPEKIIEDLTLRELNCITLKCVAPPTVSV